MPLWATVILSMAALCGKVLLPREGHIGVPAPVLTCFRAALGAATLVVLLLVMRKTA